MVTKMALPTHQDLQTLRTPADMLAFGLQYLEAGGPSAVDDDAFWSRIGTSRIIKSIVEEYMPLAIYLQKRYGNNVLGCLARQGAQHDGEVHDQTGCIENIQIVHGTESESEALKREDLAQGHPILKNAIYQRNHSTKSPEIRSLISQPRKASELAAQMIIKRIESKIEKGYRQINTLLVSYTEGQSTPYTQSPLIIHAQVRAWLQTKQLLNLAPFSKIVLVSDNGQVEIFDLNIICLP